MANDVRPLTRKELTEFLPNQRAVRAFEQLFNIVPGDLLVLIDDIQAAQGTATLAASNAARNLGLLQRIDPARKGVVFVRSASDLPRPGAGIINLAEGLTYFFTKQVDLLGSSLQLSANTALMGSSKHSCGIQSTGLVGSLIEAISPDSILISDLFINGTVEVGTASIDEIRVARCELTGMDVSAVATMDPGSYILEDCSFIGGGTFLLGIQSDDERANFTGCTGIPNSVTATGYYAVAESTVTPIGSVNVPAKAVVTTTAMGVSQRFTLTDNRATYDGVLDQAFKTSAILNLEAGPDDEISIHLAVNGTIVAESEWRDQCDSLGVCRSIKTQALLQLEETNYVEVWVENRTSAGDITVTDINLTMEAV